MIDKKEKSTLIDYIGFFEGFMKRILRDELLKAKLLFDLQKLAKEVYFGNVTDDGLLTRIVELYKTYLAKDREISEEQERVRKLEENVRELNEAIDRLQSLKMNDVKAGKVRVSITMRSEVYEALKKFAKSSKRSLSEVLEYIVLSSPQYKAMKELSSMNVGERR